MSAKVLKVILKGDDWTFSRKYLVYDEIKLDREDPKVGECIKDARECLKVTPEDEEVKCSMVNR